MKGQLLQINNPFGEHIGIWHTKDMTITMGMLTDWFRSFDDSDLYAIYGVNGFENFVKEIGYKIRRVYIEEDNL